MSKEKTITTNINRDPLSPGEVPQQHVSNENCFEEGKLVYTYTRTQALEDGVLVNLLQDEMTEVCQQHYKHPIACTLAVFEIMRKAVENKRYCNDYAGILHDMLWMSRSYKQQVDVSTVLFQVIIAGAGKKKNYTFKLVCHPGDKGEPVLTIMLPQED